MVSGSIQNLKNSNPVNAIDGTLTVIVPAYNVDGYIERCIRSIEKQGDVVAKILVINDGSTDKTLEILEKLKGDIPKICIITQTNAGAFRARCKGIRMAKTKYITFVDADDYIEHNFYQFQVKKLIENNLNVLEFGIRKIKGEKIIYEFVPKEDIYDGNEAIRRMLEKDHSNCSNCNKIYERSLFDDLKFDDDLLFVDEYHEEDKLINIKVLSKAKRVGASSEIGYYYDTREGSITDKKNNISYVDVLESMRCIYTYVKNNVDMMTNVVAYDFCAHLAFCYIYLSKMKSDDSIKKMQMDIKTEFEKIFTEEQLGKFSPQKASLKRKIMIKLFHIDPRLAVICGKIVA